MKFFFATNTTQWVYAWNLWYIGCPHKAQNEKYLGLLVMVGKLKANTLMVLRRGWLRKYMGGKRKIFQE